MPNDNVLRGGPVVRGNVAGRSARSYVGAHNDRQSRFEARTARRYGDWGILAIPTSILWFDEVCAEMFDDNGCFVPVIIDLWP